MFISFQLQLILQTSEFAYCSNNSVLKIKPHYTCQELFPFGEIILQFHFLIVYNYLMFGLKERKEKNLKAFPSIDLDHHRGENQ